MKEKSKLLSAAVAGLMGVAALASAGDKPAAKKADKDANVHCYGVNKCKAMGKCSGPGHACAGHNTCKGQGWLPMPKSSCDAIEGGTTEAPKAEAPKK
ncbi:MAG: hypothetical protein HY077_14010 [Elusimicrobia bacterium]|nr:hypothetical protein [Elusimicrobiota bacterium]